MREPVSANWLPKSSEVLRELHRPQPSQQLPDRIRRPHRQRRKKEFARLAARVTALEAENVALKQHLAIEVRGSLIPGVASPVPERPENPQGGREAGRDSTVSTITDSRRPNPVAVEEKALAAEERHRLMALAWRRQTLLWRIMADRGIGRTWSSPYWQARARTKRDFEGGSDGCDVYAS
jgi:hypothetical protein